MQPNDWAGDPDVDLQMDIESELALEGKRAPIDWAAISYTGVAQRTLEHQSGAAYCTVCNRTVSSPAALKWGHEHAEETGHRLVVDCHARFVVTRPAGTE